MATIKVIIERAENNYSAYIDGIDGVVATGSTIDEIKQNMIDAIYCYIEECKDLGCEIPKELSEDFNLIF